MAKHLPTNAELAAKFIEVVSRTSVSSMTLKETRNQILDCPEIIAEAFEKDGNLGGIKIPRLYKKFYPILEDILRNGIEEAGEKSIKQDIAKMRSKQFKGIPGSASAHVKPESTLPSWDDGIKNLES